MKNIVVLILSLVLISCGTNSRNSPATNGVCNDKNLDLATYDLKNAEPLKAPGGSNKSDAEDAQPGRYILSKALIHFQDSNLMQNGKALQYMAQYLPAFITPADKTENQRRYTPSVNCISGLSLDYAGKIELSADFPMELEATKSKVLPLTIKQMNVKYNNDQTTTFQTTDSSQKDTDGIDQINKSASEQDRVTNFSKQKDANTYQVQSRTTVDNRVVTIIATYSKCLGPDDFEDFDDKSDKQQETIITNEENCLTKKLITTN